MQHEIIYGLAILLLFVCVRINLSEDVLSNVSVFVFSCTERVYTVKYTCGPLALIYIFHICLKSAQ